VRSSIPQLTSFLVVSFFVPKNKAKNLQGVTNMTKTITVNSLVDVTAMSFGPGMRAYPRRMEYAGTSYHFVGAGLRTVVKRGERIAQILTMSDGAQDYCLRSDNQGSGWTLLSIIQ
jgi:hypothetical protein